MMGLNYLDCNCIDGQEKIVRLLCDLWSDQRLMNKDGPDTQSTGSVCVNFIDKEDDFYY